jgi:hypothetical protein
MSYTVSSALKLIAESNDRAYSLAFQPILANLLSPYASSFSLLIAPSGAETEIDNLTKDSNKYPISLLAIQAERPFDVSISLDTSSASIYSGKYSLLYLNQLADIQTGANVRFSRLDQIKIKSHPNVDTAFMATIFVSHGLL